MAEGGGLLNRYTDNAVSWVRIPSPPPPLIKMKDYKIIWTLPGCTRISMYQARTVRQLHYGVLCNGARRSSRGSSSRIHERAVSNFRRALAIPARDKSCRQRRIYTVDRDGVGERDPRRPAGVILHRPHRNSGRAKRISRRAAGRTRWPEPRPGGAHRKAALSVCDHRARASSHSVPYWFDNACLGGLTI